MRPVIRTVQTESGDVIMVDDQARIFKIANQDKMKRLAGKKAKMKMQAGEG
jgi:hypothetical protein